MLKVGKRLALALEHLVHLLSAPNNLRQRVRLVNQQREPSVLPILGMPSEAVAHLAQIRPLPLLEIVFLAEGIPRPVHLDNQRNQQLLLHSANRNRILDPFLAEELQALLAQSQLEEHLEVS